MRRSKHRTHSAAVMANPFVRIIVQVVVSGVGIIAKGLMGAYARGAAGAWGWCVMARRAAA